MFSFFGCLVWSVRVLQVVTYSLSDLYLLCFKDYWHRVFECYTGNCTSTVCFTKNKFCCYPDSSRMWTILSSLLNFHQQIYVQENRDVNSCHAVPWSNSGGTVAMREWSWHVSQTVTTRIVSKIWPVMFVTFGHAQFVVKIYSPNLDKHELGFTP